MARNLGKKGKVGWRGAEPQFPKIPEGFGGMCSKKVFLIKSFSPFPKSAIGKSNFYVMYFSLPVIFDLRQCMLSPAYLDVESRIAIPVAQTPKLGFPKMIR